MLSASPELFFRVDGGRITTRPMKGTAPRGRWLAEDEEIAARLVASSKDRAENAMIVDLLRNDLGRICRTGSVEVERMLEPERYETVWQLTSTIEGDLRPEITLLDTFRALFPSGSVTGAPKVRTTRIIADLEDSARGPYCGAIGYLAPPGTGEPRANFNVAIRTVALDGQTRTAEYGVGGGITHDSSAPGEYEEILAKARVLTDVRPAFELFESLAHVPAEGFRHLDEHLERLAASARYFGFRFEPEAAAAALKRAVDEVAAPSVVRLDARARRRAVDRRSRTCRRRTEPVRVALDDEPVDPSDVWLFHKTTRRAPYERRRERRPDVDDVLLINDRGEVTESTIANLAVRLEGEWVTPPIDAGLLAGHLPDRAAPRGPPRRTTRHGGRAPRRRGARARELGPRVATRGAGAVSDDVHTVHLGAFTHDHAEAIAGELEKAGIVWWYKNPGFFSQIWERSVRLFVDRERLDEAQAIADRVLASGQPEGEGSSSGQT